MRIGILILCFGIITTTHAAVGDIREPKIPASANLTKEEKVDILVNRPGPSVKLGRDFEEYEYLKNIAKGRSYYYRERYRKKNDRDKGYFSNVESDRISQTFYKDYTPADYLQMKRFFPRKKKLHYRELFKFGPYKTKQN